MFTVGDNKKIRVLSAGLNALSRIGLDITCTWKKDGIRFQTLAENSDVFGGFSVEATFFDTFAAPGTPGFDTVKPTPVATKYDAKILTGALRNVRDVKLLTAYFATMREVTPVLVLRMDTAKGLTRTYTLNLSDSDLGHPTFTREDACYFIACAPRMLEDDLKGIDAGREATFLLTPHLVQVQTFAENVDVTLQRPLVVVARARKASEYDRTRFDFARPLWRRRALEREAAGLPPYEELPPGERAEEEALLARLPRIDSVTAKVKELRALLAFVTAPSVSGREVGLYFGGVGEPLLASSFAADRRDFSLDVFMQAGREAVAPLKGTPLAVALAAQEADLAAAEEAATCGAVDAEPQ